MCDYIKIIWKTSRENLKLYTKMTMFKKQKIEHKKNLKKE